MPRAVGKQTGFGEVSRHGETSAGSGTQSQLPTLGRSTFRPNAEASDIKPKKAIKGSELPVLGSAAGAASATVVGAGAVATKTMTGTSAGGGGGGGGIVPVLCARCSTTVIGSSTTLVAETFIPFFKPQASTICPSTLNFWSLGILNCWFVPSSKVRITVFGGATCHT